MDNDKKLQYLKRGEVRTMEKDIARLRERESETTREKIAQIRTGQEAQKETERSEQSKRATEEREKIEREEKEKEEELARLRTERTASAALEAATAAEKEEKEKELLRAQFKGAQLKEEDKRKKFLESVAEKAGDSVPDEEEIPPQIPPPPPPVPPIQAPSPVTPPAPPMSLPLPADLSAEAPEAKVEVPLSGTKEGKKPFKFTLPSFKIPIPSFKLPKIRIPKAQVPKVSLPNVPMPKVEGYFPAKPSILAKIWIRIIISLFVLAILATIITFWYWYLAVRPQMPSPIPPAAEAVQEEKLAVTQRLLRDGYYLPASARVINSIIVHSGYNKDNPHDLEAAIQSYKTSGTAVHYLISREGAIYQLSPDYAVAFHAGSANNVSIGISLVYQESESPSDAQYQSLSRLIKNLQEKYNIPIENVLGHKDIAPSKTTPWNFDWDKFKLLISYNPSPDNGAEFIFKNLAKEEKIGQLFIIGFEGTILTRELENFIETVSPGGIILFKKNIEGPSQIKKLLRGLQEISLAETGLPLLVAVDQEGGVVSRIDFAKEKTGQSVIESADQAYKVGLERGRELRELGINLNLSPLLDLTRSGDFLRQRSFQKEAEKTGILAKALVSGQKAAGILTAIKHFPGYGGIYFNPEEKLATLSVLPQTSHFQKAMEADPEFIMAANVIYPSIDADLPLGLSPKGIAFLKEELGETPLVITDDLLQRSLLDVFSLEEVATLPIKAGVDMLLFSDWQSGVEAASLLEKATQNGSISEKLINDAALRVIKLKQDRLNH